MVMPAETEAVETAATKTLGAGESRSLRFGGGQRNPRSEKQAEERNESFHRTWETYSLIAGRNVKTNPAVLLQIIDLDHANAVAVLPGEDRRELARR